MKPGVHPLWDSPAPDAPDIQKQAHRLMLNTLGKIRVRVPDVLSDPGNAGGERVMQAAKGALLNPKLDQDLVLAALSMLQKRMASVDPQTPTQLFLPRAEHQSAISSSIGADLHALSGFEQALEAYLLERRPGVMLRDRSRLDTVDSLQVAGLLMALLVIRLGHGSMALLGKALESIDRNPWIAGYWAWVDLDLSAAWNGSMQMRRLFLDPTTLAAWLLAGDRIEQLPRPPDGLKAGKQATFYRRLARDAFKALVVHMQSLGYDPAITALDQLCRCEVQRLRMVTIPLLATYAQGDVASSSLEIGTWLRLIDYGYPDADRSGDGHETGPATSTDVQAEAQTLPLSGIDPGSERNLQEQLAAGDLEEEGLILQLRVLMSGPRASWLAGLDSILAGLEATDSDNETARLVVGWLRHLAFERTSKGKLLSDGSIRHYRGLLINRLLRILPRRLSDSDDDQLLDAYLEVIMSRRSLEQTNRIKAALVSFDRYLRDTHVPDLPRVALPGFDGAAYAISSRIIVEAEFRRGLELTRDGSIAFTSEGLANQTRAFWILAFRFGLRRTEILGLQLRDLGQDLIRIRRNEGRGLKTSNALRVVPLSALNGEERRLVRTIAEGRNPYDYLFFGDAIPTTKDFEAHPVIARINDLLERVTGDERLHPHNLRHSSATLILLGMLGHDLGIESHPYSTSWMKDCVKAAATIDGAISGQLHRKAARGSALAVLEGHGSELTTYEHYVHCFDLLLFLACWSGRFDPVKRQATRPLRPPRQETSQLLAMLGYASTTRIKTDDLSPLLQRIGNLRPGRVELLQPLADQLGPAAATTLVDTRRLPIKLQTLLELPGASAWRGFPIEQAELDTVMLMLHRINRARTDAPLLLESVIERWLDHQLVNDDWASMTADAARAWVEDLGRLGPDLGVEALHVVKHRTTRQTIKTPVSDPNSSASYPAKNGRYWVRLADGRKKQTKRKGAREIRRSSSQASVSWVLRATASLR